MARKLPALLAIAALHGLARASPEVKVALRTSWSAPPLLLEIMYVYTMWSWMNITYIDTYSESVAAENSDAFFPLLDALTDPERLGSVKPTTPEATHEFALQTAQDAGLLLPALRPIVEANLALHAAAPKIEAFYQHYNDVRRGVAGGETCEAWVDWYGEVVCDYDTLVRLVGHETIDAVAATGNSKYS
jgi:UDP-glucose:glycoprotein glucosyltransferase